MPHIKALQSLLPPRYRIKDMIGAGAMGTVYLVRDRLHSRDVALKHILSTRNIMSFDEEAQLLFRTALTNEFQTLATLKHPNVVSVLDYGFDAKGSPYFTMEWLSRGVTLLDACLDLDFDTRIELFVQLLRGLAYVHRRGVVHRDLKPSNILVTPSNQGLQVKVLDFGLSIPIGDENTTSGTLNYIAPELIHGEIVTPSSDLYPVGVLLYELFSGQHPFPYNGLVDFLDRVANDTPAFPIKGLSTKFELVIGKLLTKTPEERYPTARETILAINAATDKQIPVETVATRDSFIKAARFIGRVEELAQLRLSLQQAKNGEGNSWLLGGESGVGKSRLLDELRVDALISGIDVAVGQSRADGGSPYQIWFNIIQTLIFSEAFTDEELSLLNIFDINIASLLERHIPTPPELEADELQARLLDLIVRLVIQHKKPLLLILEDLQWEPEESLQLIERLYAELTGSQVMLVATYRIDEAPELDERFSTMQPLPLRRFDEQAVADMIAEMIGDIANRRGLIEVLRKETEGNAFFLTEIIRTLAEEVGELEAITKADKVDMPAQIRSALNKRWASLPLQAQLVLEGAALIDREITPHLLARMMPQIDIEHHLHEAAEFHVTEWRNGRWRFEHDKLRRQIIENMAVDRQETLHRQIAEAMETSLRSESDGRQYIPYIALHWEQGKEPFKALPYLIVVAQDSFRVSAFDDALTYVTRAIACIDHMGEIPPTVARQVMDAYYMLFYVFRQREQRAELWHVYEQALELAQNNDLSDLFLRAYQLGADAGALTYQATKAQECATKMLAYTDMGSGEALLAQYRLSQGFRMERRFDEAIQVAESALNSIDRSQVWRGWNFETSLTSYFALTSFFDTVNGAAWSMATTLGYCYALQGDYQNALESFRKSLDEMRSQGIGPRLMIALHNYGLMMQGHGDQQAALSLLKELQTLAPQYFPALNHTANYLVTICTARLNGDLQTAADQLLELAKVNFDEQEIEDGIICARDAKSLYEQLDERPKIDEIHQLLQQVNDPLI